MCDKSAQSSPQVAASESSLVRSLPDRSADLDDALELGDVARLEDVPDRGHGVLVPRQAPRGLDLLDVPPAFAETDEATRIVAIAEQPERHVGKLAREVARA